MSEAGKGGLDVFGLKPLSDSIHQITKVSTEGAASFLGRICNPAAEEFGLLIQDKVKRWRAQNAIAVVAIAKERHEKNKIDTSFQANPRLVFTVLEQGSWASDDVIRNMWGGLLVSSCSSGGTDDGNLVFLNTLSQLTSLQVRVLNFACQNSTKETLPPGLIVVRKKLFISLEELYKIAGVDDIHRIDRDLDHMRSLGLLLVGFSGNSGQVDLSPTAFALNLFVRCQGYIGSPLDYFGVIPPPIEVEASKASSLKHKQ